MNVCMVGYGMMGVWHSEALLEAGAVLHTLVGRRPEAARAFAERFGYRKWTLSLDEALADPAVDIVVLAMPSDYARDHPQAVSALSMLLLTGAKDIQREAYGETKPFEE